MKCDTSSNDSNMMLIDSKKAKQKEPQSRPTARLTSKQRKRQAKSEKKRKTQVFKIMSSFHSCQNTNVSLLFLWLLTENATCMK